MSSEYETLKTQEFMGKGYKLDKNLKKLKV